MELEMLAEAGCVYNVGVPTGALSTGDIIEIVFGGISCISMAREGHTCLAARHIQPATVQQVMPFQEAGGVHDRQFDGSWICIALVDASGHTCAWWGSKA
jgi:hypothetical protein